jgi:hypothetical protein
MANNTSSVEGLDEMLRFLEEVGNESDNLLERSKEAIQTAIIASMRNQEALIPQDQGNLKKSLLNPNDRAHVFEINNGNIIYGSSLPQAKYQKKKIPTPSTEAITQAIEDELDRILQGDI